MSVSAGAAPQLTQFTRFVCISRDEVAQRVQSMIDAHDFDDIGHPNLRIKGPTFWGVWLCISDRAQSGSGRLCRIRCGVLFHVAQMKLRFHGGEQATRQLLLPLFESWTYVTLDACPQRRPGADFQVPPPLVSDHQVSGSGIDCSSASIPTQIMESNAAQPAGPQPLPSCDEPNSRTGNVGPSHLPVAVAGPGAAAPVVPNELSMLSQLVGQWVQHQERMQQLLLSIHDRLNQPFGSMNHNGNPCASPQCPRHPHLVAFQMCSQHRVNEQCAIHQTF